MKNARANGLTKVLLEKSLALALLKAVNGFKASLASRCSSPKALYSVSSPKIIGIPL